MQCKYNALKIDICVFYVDGQAPPPPRVNVSCDHEFPLHPLILNITNIIRQEVKPPRNTAKGWPSNLVTGSADVGASFKEKDPSKAKEAHCLPQVSALLIIFSYVNQSGMVKLCSDC